MEGDLVMLKKLHVLVYLFIFYVILIVHTDNVSASFYLGKSTATSPSKRKMTPDEKEYRKILRLSYSSFNDFDMRISYNERWKKYCDFHIKAFLAFIYKYPRSSFIPEAKLRIAERYHISYRKGKSLQWLDDIIHNHSSDKYFALHSKNNDWTAAWALYYRGTWFKKDNDLKKIKNLYPKSRVLEKTRGNHNSRLSITPTKPPLLK